MRSSSRLPWTLLALAALALTARCAAADPPEQDFSKVEIKTEKLADGVFMLEGSGGNIGLCAGADGAFLIDDQFAPLTEKIRAAVAAVTDKPIRFVLNTHWHPDHTGGNENLGKAGALIVAHDNVRKRLSVEQFTAVFNRTTLPSPPAALPVVTFTDSVTFHLNGDDVIAFHVPPAHTDGDAIVWFRGANVAHMGDCFVNGSYPFIDLSGGGSVNGVIQAAERMLAKVDERTKIIPGHGPLGDKAALQAYRDMLVKVRDRVKKGIVAKRTKVQILAGKPTAEFDEKWGKGFLTGETFAGIVYDDLARKGR